MSTELIVRDAEGYQLTGFSGGAARGYCLQVTGDNGYIQLTREAAELLIQDIRNTFLTEFPAKASDGGYTGGPVSDGGMDPRERNRPDRRVRSMTSSMGATRDGYLVRQAVVECEDGTLWRLCDNEAGTRAWDRLPPIPLRAS